MTLRFGLKEPTIQKICGVFAHYPQIEKAVIYGSRAKGNYKPGSDIDLTLHGSALTWNILSKVMTEMDDLMLPYLFDLSLFQTINDPDFTDQVQRIGVVFYEKAGEPIHA